MGPKLAGEISADAEVCRQLASQHSPRPSTLESPVGSS